MVKRIAQDIVGALKGNPLALALVLVNVLYLVGGFVLFREERTRNATVIGELLKACLDGQK